ncbi:unnamed protein product [Sphacelaria rigidula]
MGKLGEGLAALLSQQRKEGQEKAASSGGTKVGNAGDTTSHERRAENPMKSSEASDHPVDKPHELPNQPGERSDSESRDPLPAQLTPPVAVVSGRTHDDETSEVSKASGADRNAASTGAAGTDSLLSSSSSSSSSSLSSSLSLESKGIPQPQPEKPASSKVKAEESSPAESKAEEDSGKPTTPRKAETAAAGEGDTHAPSVGTNGGERRAAAKEALSLSPMSPPPAAIRSPPLPAAIENDPQLDCTLKTLEAVHGAFYSPEHVQHGQPRDVARFLAKVRCRVLRGVRMVFSGVIPVSGAPADPRTHKLWRMAEAHGATVEHAIGRYTTHIVAVRLGTAKTSKGLRMPGVCVVHLDWLMNSVWHCRRERETMFLLAGQICGGAPPPQQPAPTTPPRHTEPAAHPESFPLEAQPAFSSKPHRAFSSSGSSTPGNKRGDVRDDLVGCVLREKGGGVVGSDEERESDGPNRKRSRRESEQTERELRLNGSLAGGSGGGGGATVKCRVGGDNSGGSACGSSSRSSSVGSDGGDWLLGMAEELENSL